MSCATATHLSAGATAVPCICGCGETALAVEGDDTFYQEGQTEDHCSDWSDYERAMARRGYTFVPVTDELRAAVNGLAAVSMPLALSEGGPWRITVQYLDDTRMECEFASLEAVRTFRARLPPFLWMEYLESLGFTFA